MTKQLEESVTKIENVGHQLETAKVEVQKPFAQEAELSEKLSRLAELNSLLNMDEKGDDAVAMDDEYKPLAKVEELEEQNYNMIDNVINNLPKDPDDKKEEALRQEERHEDESERNYATEVRSSMRARLSEKIAAVAEHNSRPREREAEEQKKHRMSEI